MAAAGGKTRKVKNETSAPKMIMKTIGSLRMMTAALPTNFRQLPLPSPRWHINAGQNAIDR
jgi:hypothetical protein